ncbi:unnamed protein product [Amoebophrya sp. A120]|nr:unnamed protein product [Amoebophrya sp. A120]|eukprot:GSA120T00021060001.1
MREDREKQLQQQKQPRRAGHPTVNHHAEDEEDPGLFSLCLYKEVAFDLQRVEARKPGEEPRFFPENVCMVPSLVCRVEPLHRYRCEVQQVKDRRKIATEDEGTTSLGGTDPFSATGGAAAGGPVNTLVPPPVARKKKRKNKKPKTAGSGASAVEELLEEADRADLEEVETSPVAAGKAEGRDATRDEGGDSSSVLPDKTKSPRSRLTIREPDAVDSSCDVGSAATRPLQVTRLDAEAEAENLQRIVQEQAKNLVRPEEVVAGVTETQVLTGLVPLPAAGAQETCGASSRGSLFSDEQTRSTSKQNIQGGPEEDDAGDEQPPHELKQIRPRKLPIALSSPPLCLDSPAVVLEAAFEGDTEGDSRRAQDREEKKLVADSTAEGKEETKKAAVKVEMLPGNSAESSVDPAPKSNLNKSGCVKITCAGPMADRQKPQFVQKQNVEANCPERRGTEAEGEGGQVGAGRAKDKHSVATQCDHELDGRSGVVGSSDVLLGQDSGEQQVVLSSTTELLPARNTPPVREDSPAIRLVTPEGGGHQDPPSRSTGSSSTASRAHDVLEDSLPSGRAALHIITASTISADDSTAVLSAEQAKEESLSTGDAGSSSWSPESDVNSETGAVLSDNPAEAEVVQSTTAVLTTTSVRHRGLREDSQRQPAKDLDLEERPPLDVLPSTTVQVPVGTTTAKEDATTRHCRGLQQVEEKALALHGVGQHLSAPARAAAPASSTSRNPPRPRAGSTTSSPTLLQEMTAEVVLDRRRAAPSAHKNCAEKELQLAPPDGRSNSCVVEDLPATGSSEVQRCSVVVDDRNTTTSRRSCSSETADIVMKGSCTKRAEVASTSSPRQTRTFNQSVMNSDRGQTCTTATSGGALSATRSGESLPSLHYQNMVRSRSGLDFEESIVSRSDAEELLPEVSTTSHRDDAPFLQVQVCLSSGGRGPPIVHKEQVSLASLCRARIAGARRVCDADTQTEHITKVEEVPAENRPGCGISSTPVSCSTPHARPEGDCAFDFVPEALAGAATLNADRGKPFAADAELVGGEKFVLPTTGTTQGVLQQTRTFEITSLHTWNLLFQAPQVAQRGWEGKGGKKNATNNKCSNGGAAATSSSTSIGGVQSLQHPPKTTKKFQKYLRDYKLELNSSSCPALSSSCGAFARKNAAIAMNCGGAAKRDKKEGTKMKKGPANSVKTVFSQSQAGVTASTVLSEAEGETSSQGAHLPAERTEGKNELTLTITGSETDLRQFEQNVLQNECRFETFRLRGGHQSVPLSPRSRSSEFTSTLKPPHDQQPEQDHEGPGNKQSELRLQPGDEDPDTSSNIAEVGFFMFLSDSKADAEGALNTILRQVAQENRSCTGGEQDQDALLSKMRQQDDVDKVDSTATEKVERPTLTKKSCEGPVRQAATSTKSAVSHFQIRLLADQKEILLRGSRECCATATDLLERCFRENKKEVLARGAAFFAGEARTRDAKKLSEEVRKRSTLNANAPAFYPSSSSGPRTSAARSGSCHLFLQNGMIQDHCNHAHQQVVPEQLAPQLVDAPREQQHEANKSMLSGVIFPEVGTTNRAKNTNGSVWGPTPVSDSCSGSANTSRCEVYSDQYPPLGKSMSSQLLTNMTCTFVLPDGGVATSGATTEHLMTMVQERCGPPSDTVGASVDDHDGLVHDHEVGQLQRQEQRPPGIVAPEGVIQQDLVVDDDASGSKSSDAAGVNEHSHEPRCVVTTNTSTSTSDHNGTTYQNPAVSRPPETAALFPEDQHGASTISAIPPILAEQASKDVVPSKPCLAVDDQVASSSAPATACSAQDLLYEAAGGTGTRASKSSGPRCAGPSAAHGQDEEEKSRTCLVGQESTTVLAARTKDSSHLSSAEDGGGATTDTAAQMNSATGPQNDDTTTNSCDDDQNALTRTHLAPSACGPPGTSCTSNSGAPGDEQKDGSVLSCRKTFVEFVPAASASSNGTTTVTNGYNDFIFPCDLPISNVRGTVGSTANVLVQQGVAQVDGLGQERELYHDYGSMLVAGDCSQHQGPLYYNYPGAASYGSDGNLYRHQDTRLCNYEMNYQDGGRGGYGTSFLDNQNFYTDNNFSASTSYSSSAAFTFPGDAANYVQPGMLQMQQNDSDNHSSFETAGTSTALGGRFDVLPCAAINFAETLDPHETNLVAAHQVATSSGCHVHLAQHRWRVTLRPLAGDNRAFNAVTHGLLSIYPILQNLEDGLRYEERCFKNGLLYQQHGGGSRSSARSREVNNRRKTKGAAAAAKAGVVALQHQQVGTDYCKPSFSFQSNENDYDPLRFLLDYFTAPCAPLLEPLDLDKAFFGVSSGRSANSSCCATRTTTNPSGKKPASTSTFTRGKQVVEGKKQPQPSASTTTVPKNNRNLSSILQFLLRNAHARISQAVEVCGMEKLMTPGDSTSSASVADDDDQVVTTAAKDIPSTCMKDPAAASSTSVTAAVPSKQGTAKINARNRHSGSKEGSELSENKKKCEPVERQLLPENSEMGHLQYPPRAIFFVPRAGEDSGQEKSLDSSRTGAIVKNASDVVENIASQRILEKAHAKQKQEQHAQEDTKKAPKGKLPSSSSGDDDESKADKPGSRTTNEATTGDFEEQEENRSRPLATSPFSSQRKSRKLVHGSNAGMTIVPEHIFYEPCSNAYKPIFCAEQAGTAERTSGALTDDVLFSSGTRSIEKANKTTFPGASASSSILDDPHELQNRHCNSSATTTCCPRPTATDDEPNTQTTCRTSHLHGAPGGLFYSLTCLVLEVEEGVAEHQEDINLTSSVSAKDRKMAKSTTSQLIYAQHAQQWFRIKNGTEITPSTLQEALHPDESDDEIFVREQESQQDYQQQSERWVVENEDSSMNSKTVPEVFAEQRSSANEEERAHNSRSTGTATPARTISVLARGQGKQGRGPAEEAHLHDARFDTDRLGEKNEAPRTSDTIETASARSSRQASGNPRLSFEQREDRRKAALRGTLRAPAQQRNAEDMTSLPAPVAGDVVGNDRYEVKRTQTDEQQENNQVALHGEQAAKPKSLARDRGFSPNLRGAVAPQPERTGPEVVDKNSAVVYDAPGSISSWLLGQNGTEITPSTLQEALELLESPGASTEVCAREVAEDGGVDQKEKDRSGPRRGGNSTIKACYTPTLLVYASGSSF